MVYTLNGTNVTAYGYVPSTAPGSNLALEGWLDMPKRLEKSYHSWPDEDGVEPWLNADLIFYDSRTIKLHLVGQFESRTAAESALQDLRDQLNVTAIMELAADGFTWNVLPSGGIEVEMLDERTHKVVISFYEPQPTVDGEIPTEPDGSNFLGIDRISWPVLGIIPMELIGRYSTPGWKEMNYTVYGKAGYEITKKDINQKTFKGLLKFDNLVDLGAGVQALYKILRQAKLLRLKLTADDQSREFFNTEGFTVRNIMVESNRVTALLEMTIIEDGIVEDVLSEIFDDSFDDTFG